jgi:hypothetical protein
MLQKLSDGEEGLFSFPCILSIVTNFIQNTYVGESESNSTSQEILYILWDPKFHYRFTKPCHIHKNRQNLVLCILICMFIGV